MDLKVKKKIKKHIYIYIYMYTCESYFTNLSCERPCNYVSACAHDDIIHIRSNSRCVHPDIDMSERASAAPARSDRVTSAASAVMAPIDVHKAGNAEASSCHVIGLDAC